MVTRLGLVLAGVDEGEVLAFVDTNPLDAMLWTQRVLAGEGDTVDDHDSLPPYYLAEYFEERDEDGDLVVAWTEAVTLPSDEEGVAIEGMLSGLANVHW